MVIETTVVGWDGTKASQAALQWGLLRPKEANLVLVLVSDAGVSTVGASARSSPVAPLHTALRNEVTRLQNADPQVSVSCELVYGDTVEELARFSNDRSLVVVGTSRRRGGGARYGWSVGARLAASAQGPIAVIPTGGEAEAGGIVVGIDGSMASKAALEFAASEADRTGDVLLAVMSWQEPPISIDATVPDAKYLRSLETMYAQIFDDSLDVLERYPRLQVRRNLVRGPASKVLLNAAEEARLIVVGNHGLRGIKRFLLGSVSRSVVAHTLCPVIVVRSD